MKRSDKDTRFITIDENRSFKDQSLNELDVGGEQLIAATHEIKITLTNVLRKDPMGSISLAANYKDKKPFETISYDEVKNRTEEDNGIAQGAAFTLDKLKTHLLRLTNPFIL